MNQMIKPQVVDTTYQPLIRDTKILNLSTQSSSGLLLNGDMKSKVYYELKNFIDYETDESVEYISVSMPYVVLCNSNYIINSNNNTLVVYRANNQTNTYTFPVGNYSASSFASQFNVLLANVLTIQYNQITGKYSLIAITYEATLKSQSTIDYIMGFSGDTVIATGTATVLPRVAIFLPVPRFNVCCDFLNNGTVLNGARQFNNSTVIASVPNNSKNNNLIVYESDANEFILKTLTLNSITLSIVDDAGKEIDFNGVASYFQLRFSIFRKKIPRLLPFHQILDLANTTEQVLANDEYF